ncbi:MAG: ADP-forming succinate--CoA ligase subunit beta [Alphaproteobacteria bacterium]|nr:ADP-forming succinate--CoA ligase subunit beta [Alphaproteobacteria bacterium]
MDIHEYQAKGILSGYNVPLLNGRVAYTPEDAENIAQSMPAPLWVVKAQIHAGGRGKVGGVLLAHSVAEVKEHAKKLLNSRLVTHQTNPSGQEVKRIYVEEGCSYERELYLGLTLDRQRNQLSFIASSMGGIDIEEVAQKNPEQITTINIDCLMGIQPFHTRHLCKALQLTGKIAEQFHELLTNLYNAMLDLDASLIEINPLVVVRDATNGDRLVALDAKMSFDDSSLCRHPEIDLLRDEEEDSSEQEAKRHGLSYVKLDGTIGCMVNGAGLAMATMDIIQLHGGMPANFLDVGGGATPEKVKVAFKLILADPSVEAVLVNIFGGIMKCDIIAEGIVAAAKETELGIPMVIRLQGTNREQGKKILFDSGLPVIAVDNLEEAAIKVVLAARESA